MLWNNLNHISNKCHLKILEYGHHYIVVVVLLLRHVCLFVTPWTTRLLCPSLPPRVYLCPLSLWCYLSILSSADPFFSCPQYCPVSGSFPVSHLFVSGGKSTGASPSATVLQFSSITQSCPTLCDPMNRSTPGLPVYHQLPEFSQTHVHWVGDAIQPSHPLSSPSPPAPNSSQHQGLSQWVSSSHEVAKVWKFQLQHQSFQWIPRTDLL